MLEVGGIAVVKAQAQEAGLFICLSLLCISISKYYIMAKCAESAALLASIKYQIDFPSSRTNGILSEARAHVCN